ncbi:DUF6114 domain-containing protein [Kitasatospora mediocidica]|uniref:DUF6114 domain-containing protein n=1 Tax=Kitasatospora mediocidica TaxID=58352 RepID=UPI000B2AFDEA|nr:DUF6114 domain-containing protein [Kitasatospora mediocidica]
MTDAAASDPDPAAIAEPQAAATPPDPPVPAATPRAAFAAWRGRRPFWGGLLVTLAGAEILFTEKAPLPVVLRIGMMGLAGYLVPTVLLLCGVLILFNPSQRLFYSVLAVLLTLGTWITSNLGGFLLGLLLGLIGSSLSFGWLPEQPARRKLRGRSRSRRGSSGAPPQLVDSQG